MQKFSINVNWHMSGTFEIIANSLEEAIKKTETEPLPEGSYVKKSLDIDEDTIEVTEFSQELKERIAAVGLDFNKLNPLQLECMEARLDGVWDNKLLMDIGPLDQDINTDLRKIAFHYGLGNL